MSVPVIGYGRQSIDDDDIEAVVEVLRSDFLTQGPAVERFEAALAARVGARHAIAVSSGTAALHIACLAAGMGPGGIGVVPTLTFAATANAVLYCGGEARLADIEKDTLNLSVETLAATGTLDGVKAVLPVHFAGLSADMAELRQAVGASVAIIEDACHALGAVDQEGSRVGACAHGDMTVFSFHPVKTITTGEGGAITTNDDELARKLKLLRNHGIERDEKRLVDTFEAFETDGQRRPWYYEQQLLGFNYRMTDMQAALGVVQLAKLDSFLNRRREIAKYYDERFGDLSDILLPQSDPDQRARSGLHLYLLDIDFDGRGMTRTNLMSKLREAGIGTQVHYVPVHLQPYHRARGERLSHDFANAHSHYCRTLSIPLYPAMTDTEVDYVSETIRGILL